MWLHVKNIGFPLGMVIHGNRLLGQFLKSLFLVASQHLPEERPKVSTEVKPGQSGPSEGQPEVLSNLNYSRILQNQTRFHLTITSWFGFECIKSFLFQR